MSSYFDITLKKQLAVSALIEVHIIVADFILISFSVLQIDARLLTAGPGIPLVPRMGVMIWNMSHAEPIGVFQRDVARWATASFSCTIA